MATATEKKTKTYILPFPEGSDAPKQTFYSIAGKDYILRYGEEIELPEHVYDYIMEQERAKLDAVKRSRALSLKEPKKS